MRECRLFFFLVVAEVRALMVLVLVLVLVLTSHSK
jgi:hypothetical protein